MKIIRCDLGSEAIGPDKLVWQGLDPGEAEDKAKALNAKFGDRFIYSAVADDYELRT